MLVRRALPKPLNNSRLKKKDSIFSLFSSVSHLLTTLTPEYCELHKVVLVESWKVVSDALKAKAEMYRLLYTNNRDLDMLRRRVRIPQRFTLKLKSENMRVLTGHFTPPSVAALLKRPTFKNIYRLRAATHLIDLSVVVLSLENEAEMGKRSS